MRRLLFIMSMDETERNACVHAPSQNKPLCYLFGQIPEPRYKRMNRRSDAVLCENTGIPLVVSRRQAGAVLVLRVGRSKFFWRLNHTDRKMGRYHWTRILCDEHFKILWTGRELSSDARVVVFVRPLLFRKSNDENPIRNSHNTLVRFTPTRQLQFLGYIFFYSSYFLLSFLNFEEQKNQNPS